MVGHERVVEPSKVRFTQDSISEVFGDRGQSVDQETIEKTFEMLLYGDVTVNSIRPISVVQKDGLLWAVSGNRRLYVYRKLEEYRRISQITVNVVPINRERFQQMFSTKNQGLSIYIRQDRKRALGDKMEDRLRKIYQRWIRDGRPTDGHPPVQRSSRYGGDYHASSIHTPLHTTRSSISSYASDEYRIPSPRPAPTPSPTQAQWTPPPPERVNARANDNDSWCAIL